MKYLNENDILEIFNVNSDGEITLLLGAGASVSSDIPSGQDMIWDFKRKIYCRENNISESKFNDILCENNRRILQNYFDNEGVAPQRYAYNEYSYYFKRCYTLSHERKKYITEKMRDKKPSLGYLCLGELIKQRNITKLLTTNFDELIEAGVHTLHPNLTLNKFSHLNISKDNYNPSIPTIVSMHGDFKYDDIQNTNDELKALEDRVIERCKQLLHTGRLIIIGYAGNDDSIMSFLEDSLSENLFPNGIIWCKKDDSQLNTRVMEFMEKACVQNSNSAIADIGGFDILLHRIYKSKQLENATIEELIKNETSIQPLIFHKQKESNLFLKTNSFYQIEIPSSCLSFDTDLTWKELKAIKKCTSIIAGLHKGKIMCFSDKETLRNIFSAHIKSEIVEIPFIPPKFKEDTSVEMGLLYDIIAYDLVTNKNLIQVGKRRFYDPNQISHNKKYFEAIEIGLSFIRSSICLTILPTIELANKSLDKFKRQKEINAIIGYRHNKDVYVNIRNWCQRLKDNANSLTFRTNSYKLKFQAIPLSCGGNAFRQSDWGELNCYIYKEPMVCFSEDDNAPSYINQLKGLKANNPLTDSYSNINQPDIRLAILSPRYCAHKIYEHLIKLNKSSEPKNDPFLPSYSGFESVFKRKLIIPSIESPLFFNYDFDPKTNKYDSFYEHAKSYISSKIQQALFDVLIIYIPKEYAAFRECKTDDTYFDFHDAIKLFCADKGIHVQIIEEKSINYYDNCKVMWALSTSLYTKANGELWKPKNYNKNTAFIGISYALKRDGRHYLGCSQLFDSAGRGMKLQLKELFDPKLIGKNPYMCSSDAFKIVSELRNTYSKFVPTDKLNRVVIHKTTPFTQNEIRGINQALTGIEDIELIQVQEYPYWRALLANIKDIRNGEHFCLPRGSVIQLDNESFLLWTHGAIKSNELCGENLNYYKGGRGIPAPLLIRRYQGNGSGDDLAKEILMLSKMNLNSGDSMYKILPVTLDFAKTIARMVKQQDRQINNLYDFRFFM